MDPFQGKTHTLFPNRIIPKPQYHLGLDLQPMETESILVTDYNSVNRLYLRGFGKATWEKKSIPNRVLMVGLFVLFVVFFSSAENRHNKQKKLIINKKSSVKVNSPFKRDEQKRKTKKKKKKKFYSFKLSSTGKGCVCVSESR